jgi:tetratricopeptide (TPR) repeat protein/cellulose biosynthesis protein BcsQ
MNKITGVSGRDGTIVTFYSYKGGTGRTMALANVGWILASSGAKVLLLDWDLEGPGLQHYLRTFLPAPKTDQPGLIDYFWDAAAYAADPLVANAGETSPPAPDLLTFADSVRYPFPDKGSLQIIRAGAQDRMFAARVQDFSWRHFYENLGGSQLLDELRRKLKHRYDWVLIDSRTGLSDTSGICTVKLPDVLVNCFVPNMQSIEGARAVAQSVMTQSKKAIRILPLPCRIENAETVLLGQARSSWRRQHQEFLDQKTADSGYWGDVEIPYRPNFAFTETLACLVDTPGLSDSILAKFERLTSYITNGAVTELQRPEILAPAKEPRKPGESPQVFLSYAHDGPEHVDQVRTFWLFLRANGIDAVLDLPGAEKRMDWPNWINRQILNADYILAIASPTYRLGEVDDRASGPGLGLGWEQGLIKDRLYADQRTNVQIVVPVVLPDGSPGDIPLWLAPASATYYSVSEFTVTGAEKLLRKLLAQPGETEPPLGQIPVLPSRSQDLAGPAARPALRTELVIEANLAENGLLSTAVWLAGSLLRTDQAALPFEIVNAWQAAQVPADVAANRLAETGRRLGTAVFGDSTGALVAGLLEDLDPDSRMSFVLVGDARSLSLPAELIQLSDTDGEEIGPLGLQPGVSVIRRLAEPDRVIGSEPPAATPAQAALPGPFKILAAVAAPDETKTTNVPLDAEAEMQAILDAVTTMTGRGEAQVRILEVASLGAIRRALMQDAYHVLHLSAHGTADALELEDEDGYPIRVTALSLVTALRQAGRAVPLIMLSACGEPTGSLALAAGLVTHGASRAIAMLSRPSDSYATAVARHFYRQVIIHPSATVGESLTWAHRLASNDGHDETGQPAPGYGPAVLVTTDADGPLVDVDAPLQPLSIATRAPSGGSVLELPMGTLIGRRAELRTAMAVLRGTDAAVREYGAASGVVLTGIAGIGKTALAGRITSRLREEGWLVAVHEGRWNPTALIWAVANALSTTKSPNVEVGSWDITKAQLNDSLLDDGLKVAIIRQLLNSERLLLVFDDFEQNLAVGGEAFLDPALDEIIAELADAATTGKLLITSRYPLPGPDLFLAQIALPPLSPAELRRLFLRLPAIADLDEDDRQLLARTIGGHPRLIEFTDALLRGGRANLKHVQTKLRSLAREQGLDLTGARSLSSALTQAMLLGGTDVLVSELIELLTPRQVEILLQVAVCHAPMTLDDLSFALTDTAPKNAASVSQDRDGLADDVQRLTDLTLLTTGPEITMHPWTAAVVTRNVSGDPLGAHERALRMRFHRFEQGRGAYGDLIDVPYHLAALGQYDNLAALANEAVQVLDGTLAKMAYLAEVQPLIPPQERAWNVVTDLQIQVLIRIGDIDAASRRIQASVKQAQARAAADPANTQWQRDLSISHSRLGDLATATGDLDAARTAYQTALGITERLAAADPANAQPQRDLSVSHSRLGDLATATGDLTEARNHYQAALDIRQRLAAADPANTQWQRDLSISHSRLGDLATTAGDLPTGRSAYQAALDIRQRLAAADPANTQWQRDLSVSNDRLGDLATAAGDPFEARKHYQTALDIRQRLAAADPADTQWQRDLSVSYSRLADLATDTGDLDAARSAYQAALDITERLAAADPANTQWQRDLSVSYSRLGDLAIAAGDLDAAGTAYQTALDITERLAAADPANTQWRRDLSVSYSRLGDLAAAVGDPEAARRHYQASLSIRQHLTDMDPANARWQSDLIQVQNKVSALDSRSSLTDPQFDSPRSQLSSESEDNIALAGERELNLPGKDID